MSEVTVFAARFTRLFVMLAGLNLLLGAAQAQAAAAAGSSQPQTLDLSINAGLVASDNIQLRSQNEVSGTIAQGGLRLRHAMESLRLRSELDINTTYQHYLDNEYDDDIVGGVAGNLVVGIVPDRFEWLFADNLGQTRVDPFAVDTPDNRENLNFFTTGPDFIFRFSDQFSMRLSGRYSLTDYEITPLDGERTSAAISLIRQWSKAGSISLNVEAEQLELDNKNISGKYDRQEAYLRYALGGGRTEFATDVGYTRIETSGTTIDDGALVRLSLRRRTSPSSSLNFELGTEFSDSGNLLRDSQDDLGITLDSTTVIATGESFAHQFAMLTWDFSRGRNTFGVVAGYEQDDYQTTTVFDRSLTRAGLYYGRDLSRALHFRADTRYTDEKFESINNGAQQFIGSLALNWNIGAKLVAGVRYDYLDSSSDVDAKNYTENRISLTVGWSPLARR